MLTRVNRQVCVGVSVFTLMEVPPSKDERFFLLFP